MLTSALGKQCIRGNYRELPGNVFTRAHSNDLAERFDRLHDFRIKPRERLHFLEGKELVSAGTEILQIKQSMLARGGYPIHRRGPAELFCTGYQDDKRVRRGL